MTDIETAIARGNTLSGKAIALCHRYHNQEVTREEWVSHMNAIFEEDCKKCPVTFGWVIKCCENLIAPIDWDYLSEQDDDDDDDNDDGKTTTLMEVPLNKLLLDHSIAVVMLRCFQDWLAFPTFKNSDLGHRAQSALQYLQLAQKEQEGRSEAWKKAMTKQLAASTKAINTTEPTQDV